MTKALPAWGLYLLSEVGIVGAWLVSILTPAGADFNTMVQTGPLKALVILEVTWAIACAAHWRATGDPTPVEPAMISAESVQLSPHLLVMRGTMDEFDAKVEGLSALIHDASRQIQDRVDALPALPPPSTPVLR